MCAVCCLAFFCTHMAWVCRRYVRASAPSPDTCAGGCASGRLGWHRASPGVRFCGAESAFSHAKDFSFCWRLTRFPISAMFVENLDRSVLEQCVILYLPCCGPTKRSLRLERAKKECTAYGTGSCAAIAAWTPPQRGRLVAASFYQGTSLGNHLLLILQLSDHSGQSSMLKCI